MSYLDTRKKHIKSNKCACNSESVGPKITQPDLSRTIRQILKDTVEGRPSPTELNPQEYDSSVHSTNDPGKLHNLMPLSNDRLEANDQGRAKAKASKEEVDKNVKALKTALNKQKAENQAQKENELSQLRKEVSELRSNKRTD